MRVAPNLYSLRIKEHDMRQMGVHMSVLSLGPPGFDFLPSNESRKMATYCNSEIASIQDSYPDRYIGLASLPMRNMNSALEELDRSVKELGLKGVIVFSNVDGKIIDSEEFWPLFERLSELDIPMLLHPTQPVNSENFKDMASLIGVGFLFDTTLATVRIVFSGILERYPRLKIVLAHLGSFIPYILPRVDIETELISKAFPTMKPDLPKQPSFYFKKIYVDTVSHHEPAFRCCLETLGADKMLLGSDHPYSIWKRAAKEVEEEKISTNVKAKILGENALKLLRVDRRKPGSG
jgi:aminocarboxymuconate-semialdehyde decarboxylase